MSKDILVIDDEMIIRESFVLALKDTGYETDTAETGEEGIEKERKNLLSMFIHDMKNPRYDSKRFFIFL